MRNLVMSRNGFNSLVDRFFNEVWNDFADETSIASKSAFPKLDVYTTDDSYILEADVAGFKKEDINLEITKDNVLRIYGKYVEDKTIKNYLVRELSKREFERFLRLPNCLEGDPEATFDNGKLFLKWKMRKENTKRRIELK